MTSLRNGARMAPLACLLAAAAVHAQLLPDELLSNAGFFASRQTPTYFGTPGLGPTGPVQKYQHPWTNSVFGYRTCRTEADDQARFERQQMIAMGQHIAALNRLHPPKPRGYLAPNGAGPLAHVNGNYGQGFGATEQQECTQERLHGLGRAALNAPQAAVCLAGKMIAGAGQAWANGQYVGCAFEGDHYGGCANGAQAAQAAVHVAAGAAKTGLSLAGGLLKGVGGCASCGGKGCAACGGHGAGLGGALRYGMGGCAHCGGKGCASCNAGRGQHGAGGLGMAGHGPGGAFNGPMPPYYSAYPGMNREDALRYVEGFQNFPPNQIVRSPRDFYMWDVRYGLGK